MHPTRLMVPNRRLAPLLLAGAVACTGPADDRAVSDDTDVEAPIDSGPSVLDDTDPAPRPDDTAAPIDDVDLRVAGSHTVVSTSGRFKAGSGCGVSWQRFAPEGGSTAPLVVLTHGLQRTEAQMIAWAEHLATWGLDVVTPTVCYASIIAPDQVRNGRDIVELAKELRPGPVIYAGHSGGGLASWVAAAEDPDAVGLFGLDPVEYNTIGRDRAAAITMPAYAVIGDDSPCNGYGNPLGLLQSVPSAQWFRVVDADHCDFEVPTGPICTIPCGKSRNDRFSDDEIRDTIRGLMTAALLDMAGLRRTAPAWWAPGGTWYEAFQAEGRIE